ncbi:MAG: DUF4132 domain-containing protein [Myxococcales bacterium]|nr:DUF4132 domain-containing protein [Myxococcales bacterium]
MFRVPATRRFEPLDLPAPEERFEGFRAVDQDALRAQLGHVSLDDARAAVTGGTATLAVCAVALPDDELTATWETLAPWAMTPPTAIRLTIARLGERALPRLRTLLGDGQLHGGEALLDVRASWVALALAKHLEWTPELDRSARAWLADEWELAAPTIVHAALTQGEGMFGLALEWLDELDGARLREVADTFGPEARAALDARLDPERGPSLTTRPLPKVYRAQPPPRRRGGEAIDAESMDQLGRLLATLPPHHPLVREAVEALEPEDAATLGQVLLDSWVEGRMATQNRWIAGAYAALTGDVGGLGRRGRKWDRGKDTHERRAAKGIVQLLRAFGTDDAAAELATFAASARDAKVRAEAEHALWRLARVRGVEIDELPAPTLELDAELSYGSRVFRSRLSPRLELELVAPDDKVLETLPRALKADDAGAVKEAKRAWKELKSALADAMRSEARRLEDAMVSGRTWSVTRLRERAARSEVASAIQRRVVWIDRARGLAVRMAEDGSFATIDDESVEVEAPLGVAHRLELSAPDVARWSMLFADYGELQPFPQLAREVVPEPPIGRVFAVGHVVGLWKNGWQPEGGSGGYATSMTRRFARGCVRATISPGVPLWDVKYDPEPQTLEQVEAVGEVSAIERSEAHRDLA